LSGVEGYWHLAFHQSKDSVFQSTQTGVALRILTVDGAAATLWRTQFLYRAYMRAVIIMPSDSPRLRGVKTLLGQLSKPLEGSFASTELRSKMLRELRFQATAHSVVALKDHPQLTKSRAIDQEKVMALQEA